MFTKVKGPHTSSVLDSVYSVDERGEGKVFFGEFRVHREYLGAKPQRKYHVSYWILASDLRLEKDAKRLGVYGFDSDHEFTSAIAAERFAKTRVEKWIKKEAGACSDG